MIASCAGSARAGCQYDSEISLKSRAVNILFIHQNFPGQFVHLSAELAKDKRNKVVALSIYKLPAPAGVMVRHYTMLRPAAPETHPLLQDQEAKVLRAEACAAAALQLKREGFVPDLIVAHPGWGEALFMKDVFPQARLVIYCEYYYALEGQDVGFDPEIPPLNFQQRCRLRLKNTTNLLSMEIADAAISPTLWQKSTFPAWAQDKITVIHDGIDTTRLQPNPHAELTLAATSEHGAVHIKAGDEVLTYVARNLEPVRGFHVFMRILPEVLRRRPKALAIVVGGDGVGYGHSAPNGKTWKEHMLAEVGDQLDLSRVHFVGQVPYEAYLQVLQVSRIHAYWTTPFVLSWSFLDAALSGLPVVASDTAPVQEFAPRLGVSTVGFFDAVGYKDALVEGLSRKTGLRKKLSLPDIDLKQCLALQKAYLLGQ
jgi:glycosyltransferase involved in cell wall biosynthesis